MRRVLLWMAAMAGAAAGGWMALVRRQGDPEIAFDLDGTGPRWQFSDERTAHADITLVNRGRDGAVVHRLEARLVQGPSGRVTVNRQGSRPHENGWWVSNVMKPGDTCVAEVAVDLDEPATGPVRIELDAHELGRRLKVHRTAVLDVPLSTTS